MCTWPRGGLRSDFKKHWQYMYFNECMSGFEWQAAAHMIFEGAAVSRSDNAPALLRDAGSAQSLTLRGLAVARSIHDRYAPHLRNPYNEVECSDHYARAAASYSIFLAACGFELDGPEGKIGFSPRIEPENFKAPFTAPEGWGTFEQRKQGGKWTAALHVVHGHLRLRSLRLTWLHESSSIPCSLAGQPVAGRIQNGELVFESELVLKSGASLMLG